MVLDAGPLGEIIHPRAERNAGPLRWLGELRAAGVAVRVPEIADYELRRELLRIGSQRGIERLETIEKRIGYLPITTGAMRLAAGLWAQARERGEPTAPPEVLDADAVLAAQTLELEEEIGGGRRVVVATTNVSHLSRFVAAEEWWRIGVQ